MALAPGVSSLSLTGIFERLLMNDRPSGCRLLQSVTIGPTPPQWLVLATLDYSALKTLTKLRLCDVWIIDTAASQLTGEERALPCLTTLQWCMSEEYTGQEDGG